MRIKSRLSQSRLRIGLGHETVRLPTTLCRIKAQWAFSRYRRQTYLYKLPFDEVSRYDAPSQAGLIAIHHRPSAESTFHLTHAEKYEINIYDKSHQRLQNHRPEILADT
ncbi:MAG TPA: hypothetical protein VI279_06290 [Rhodocyclaceae bacterium]